MTDPTISAHDDELLKSFEKVGRPIGIPSIAEEDN